MNSLPVSTTALTASPLPQQVRARWLSGRIWLLSLLSVLSCLALSGCGFRMQGETPMPFSSLSINIAQNSQFGADLRRAIRAASPNTKLIEQRDMVVKAGDLDESEDSEDKATINRIKAAKVLKLAQARLEQTNEAKGTRIVAINAQGKPEEYELSLSFTFRLVTAKNQILLPETTLYSIRSMPFDDRVVQAKEGEAVTLFKDMQRSLVTRIMRRITAPDITQRWDTLAKLTPEDDEEEETVASVTAPTSAIPPMWQNPSLTPAPVTVGPE
jgi:LPS-assembly lipoprotein